MAVNGLYFLEAVVERNARCLTAQTNSNTRILLLVRIPQSSSLCDLAVRQQCASTYLWSNTGRNIAIVENYVVMSC